MRFRLTPRSMTLDDLELYKFEFSENFSGFRRFRTQQQHNRMKIDQYCQRQRCKHVNLVQFWHAFASRRFVSDSWAFLFSQSCPECTAQAVFSAMKSDHISPLLHELHWLRILDRIRFRLCVLVDGCLHGTAPTLSRRQHPSNRRRRRSSSSTLFRLGHVGRGTDEPFNTRRPCFPSGCVKSVE